MMVKPNKKLAVLLALISITLIILGLLLFSRRPSANSAGPDLGQINPPQQPSVNLTANEQSNPPIDLTGLSIPVLMYHHIRDYDNQEDKIGMNLSVSPQKFISELNFLKDQGFTTIKFEDLANNYLPDKPIILTFDDGYQNFYDNAFPALIERGQTGVVFVISGFLDKPGYLSTQNTRALSQEGIEIGSHTINHPDLSTANQQKATKEISQSKQTLESLIGKKIISFCYPSGKYTDETINLLKEYGYQFATTTKPGVSKFNSPFILQRIRINPDTNIAAVLK